MLCGLLARNKTYTYKKISLGLLFVVCIPLVARADDHPVTPSARELGEGCSEFSMAGMHECLLKKRDESQNALAQAEAHVIAVLSSRWDVEDQFIVLAKKNFVRSNSEFVKYREEQCGFIKSLGASAIGNALETREYACLAELNYRRAAQLQDAVSDLPLK
ncbi:lysozyme inhibitor LprI family protein [Komagataeibacter swingsii]|nr:lysozyme inhibitor LprI family protein [Komagataeibacter swingsii]GBQ63434.1 hypothetical protein AA16373_2673 [Komagataeibacter swingsii DSM 16373]